MDFNLQMELQEYLNSHERLLWAEQPKKGIVFSSSDIDGIPFSLVWCGFSIFWVIFAAQFSLWFAMFGIPFVLIGLMLVFGRFIVDAQLRKNTIYGITNNRVIIKSGIFKKTIKSLPILSLTVIEYKEKKDGSGTITLEPTNHLRNWSWGNGMNWWPGIKPPASLDLIPDVRNVYNKIMEIQKGER